MEKAEIEILKLSGECVWAGDYRYRLTNLTLKFSNPEEGPLLVQTPPAVEIYKGKEQIAVLLSEGLEKNIILLHDEETIFTFSWFEGTFTTNVKEGEEYQLTLIIYSVFRPFTGEKKELQGITINFKVPPRTP
jgi:hypothetical protein